MKTLLLELLGMTLERMRSAVESLYVSPPVPQNTDTSQGPPKSETPPETPKQIAKIRLHPALAPVHVVPSTSLLATAERVQGHESRNVNFRGILNLFFIILFVLNVRLIVENVMRYGSLLELPRIGVFDSPMIFAGYILVLSLPYISFVTERYVAIKSRWLANVIEASIIAMTLVLPYVIVRYSEVHALRSLLLLMASMVYAMKIGSYWHCCADLQRLKDSGELQTLIPKIPKEATPIDKENGALAAQYPESLTVGQMYLFVASPTLVFQLAYPRTSEVRLKMVLRYSIELVFCFVLQFVLIEQYINPLLTNTIKGIEERILKKQDYFSLGSFLLERFLKLSIPILYIWLLMFAELFHCWLNILAEVTRFADRKFYLDWWNAVSIRDYWQKWNLPVHHWLLRHMYKPLRKSGISPSTAGLVIFILSGVIHEYLIITPIQVGWSGLILLGFVLQIPLISVTDTDLFKKRPTLGNCMFWISWCFTGQPLAVLVYFVVASSPTVVTRLCYWLVYGTVHDEL